jgi:3-mercaptopyruvate sulfurtransferase SseA
MPFVIAGLRFMVALFNRFVALSFQLRTFMSTATSAPLLVAPSWLHQLKRDAKPDTKLTILDATWVMPDSPRVPSGEYISKRIPGARFIGLDEVASPHELGLKHMIPSERTFADACGELCSTNQTPISLMSSNQRTLGLSLIHML